MSIYENTQMGITEGELELDDLTPSSGSNPTAWQYLDVITHPTRVQPKIVVTPKSKIAGFVAWVEDIVLSPGTPQQGGRPIRWRFKISYSQVAIDTSNNGGDRVGWVATSTWN